jgi:3-oxoacyl-[acyl-carrier-protein] synthase II
VADRRRVAITGIGALTPIGITRDALWQGLLARRSAVRPVSRFDASIYRSQIAAEIDFHPSDFIEERKVKRLDRFGQFTVACSRLAVEDAHLDMAVEDRERVGSMMGSALGGVGFAEEQFGVFLTQGIKNVAVSLATNVFAGAASCNVAIEFGAQGPNSTNAMSCASGTMGIGEGFRQIRDDYADVMICGGVEAPLNQLCFGAFALIRAMSTRNDDPMHASRPFDRDRDGFVIGEGAGCVVLEPLERARARGATIYGEVAGYGRNADAYHITAPSPGGAGAAVCMQLALDDAGVEPSAIGHVNAHGTSTPLNDAAEAEAVRKVFGDSAPVVTSTKGVTGHLIGAAGAVEAVAALLSVRDGIVPPTANLEKLGDDIELDVVAGSPREIGPKPAISNSFGFGGHNACLVIAAAD